MARRAPTAKKAPAAKKQRAADSDLAILHPNLTVTVRDRTVTAREYGFVEGMRLQAGIQHLLDALFALFSKPEGPPTAHEVRQSLIAHAVAVQWLMAQAITPYPEREEDLANFTEAIAKNAQWVASLNDIEGDALMGTWWAANGGFFTRRLREMRLAAAEAERRSTKDASTPP